MKKIILLSALIFVAASGFSTHLMGGQITAEQISGLTYLVKLTIYRDASPNTASVQTTVNLTYINISTNNSFTTSAPYFGPVMLLNDVEEYTYIHLVTFPEIGTYQIYWGGCCRNNAIINSMNPGNMSMTLFNILTVDTLSGNSSPVFLNPPVVLAQLYDTFYYNPLPLDVDSITWKIDTPFNTFTFGSPYDYIIGYVAPFSTAGGPFTMNPLTGEITWIPNSLGNFVASFIIEEFRNGVKIGEIRRDMQYIVVDVPGNNDKAILNTSGWPIDPNGNFSFDIDINTPFTLNIDVSDAGGDSIFVEATGEPFLLQNNAATWTNLNTAPGISENEFSWNATANEMRINPYIVAFRIFETHGNYTLVKDKTVLLNVSDFTSVNENNFSNSLLIYPNPTTDELFLSVTAEKASDLKIIFLNQLGQEIRGINKKMNAGKNVIYLNNLNLPSGIYFINIKIDDDYVSNNYLRKKIVIK